MMMTSMMSLQLHHSLPSRVFGGGKWKPVKWKYPLVPVELNEPVE